MDFHRNDRQESSRAVKMSWKMEFRRFLRLFFYKLSVARFHLSETRFPRKEGSCKLMTIWQIMKTWHVSGMLRLYQYLQALVGYTSWQWGRLSATWPNRVNQTTEDVTRYHAGILCNVSCSHQLLQAVGGQIKFDWGRSWFMSSSKFIHMWRRVEAQNFLQHIAIALLFTCLRWPDLILSRPIFCWMGPIGSSKLVKMWREIKSLLSTYYGRINF